LTSFMTHSRLVISSAAGPAPRGRRPAGVSLPEP